MYKAITLIILTCIVISKSYSQTSFRPGSITNNGEKKAVSIKYRNWGKNPTLVSYKTKEGLDGSARPGEIERFDVVRPDGATEIYESYVVLYDTSPTNLNELDFSPQPILKHDTVFLMALIKGKLSLYSLKDQAAKQHYFIRKEGDTIQELGQKKYFYNRDQREYRNTDQFKNQLSALVKDSKAVSTDMIMGTEYTSKALMNLVSKYNGGKAATVRSYNFQREKSHADISLMIGLSNTGLKFNSNGDNPAWANQHFNRSTSIAVGLGAVAYIGRTKGLLGIRGELFYRSYKVKSEGDRYELTDGWIETDYELGFRTIKLNMGLQYFLLKGKGYGIYTYMGLSGGNNSPLVNKMHQDRNFSGVPSVVNDVAMADYRKLEEGYVIALGGRFRQFGFEGRLEQTTGFSAYSGLGTKITSIYGLSSYSFGR